MTEQLSSASTATTVPVARGAGLLRWRHRRGDQATCLARVVLLADSPAARPQRAVVVLSELRENPRGLGVTADVPGAAAAVRAWLPSTISPEAIEWYAHHGRFSTFDAAGADTFTRLRPRWDGFTFTDVMRDHELLRPAAAAGLVQLAALRPVADELAGWAGDPARSG